MDRSVDWNRMRAFLATAETGSLSAAARSLSLTQPTLSRQISALEEELGLLLFERVGRGLELTAAGREVLVHVRAMGLAADKAAIAAVGQSQTIDGEVRITASDILSAYFMPDVVKRLQVLAPKLRIDIVADNDIRDLMRREADIAIRHVRPEQPDLVARLIRQAQGFFYASRDYVAKHGAPKSLAAFSGHDFISFGNNQEAIGFFANIGIKITEDNFRTGSYNGLVAWEMARAGLGVAAMYDKVGDSHDDMIRLFPDKANVTFPFWLTTHREIHTNPRIRLVFDVLAEEFSSEPTG